MKIPASPRFVLAALLSVLSVGTAGAIQLTDGVGRWVGVHQETRGGLGFHNRVRITGKRLAGGGLLLIERGRSAEFGDYLIKYWFYKSGRFAQSTIAGGMIVQTADGAWEKTAGKIVVRGTGGNDAGVHRFHGSLRAKAGERMKYTGRSGGLDVTLNVRPLRTAAKQAGGPFPD